VFGARQHSQASLNIIPALFVIDGSTHNSGDVLGPRPLTSTLIDLGDEVIIKDNVDSHGVNISRGEGHNYRRGRVLATVKMPLRPLQD
jgi:hypothetical protein